MTFPINDLPQHVKLIAVSKNHPIEEIRKIYHRGQRIFGESRVQEFLSKREKLPQDIEWHFMGHLQTNKVKYIVPFVTLIHAVDSLKLLTKIDTEAAKEEKKIDVLLQIHIAQEKTKYGFEIEEIQTIMQPLAPNAFKNIRIRGLMGMASHTDNRTQIRNEFKTLRNTLEQLQTSIFCDTHYFSELSMGMSQDYTIAIEEGSTMVRIGRRIFTK